MASVVAVTVFKSIAKSITDMMPHGLASISETLIIIFVVFLLLQGVLTYWRPALVQRVEPELIRDKHIKDRYMHITFLLGVLIVFIISILGRWYFKVFLLENWVENFPENLMHGFLGRIILWSLYVTIAYGFFEILSWLLRNVNKDTSFWIGVGFFVVARTILIWHSASDVWIHPVAQ
jgi:hypothetical protein